MAETKRTILLEYEIETGKLLDANGKVIKSIKQLKEEVEAAAAANQKMGDVVGKNSEVVLGSISHIRNQVAALKQQRDSAAVGSQEFQNLNAKLTEAQARLKAATTATIQHSNAQEGATQTTRELAKLQENQARSAGLAGAAAFELGRTISDLPFGLVAISNNVSQLGTLFAALVVNAKGVGNAFKLLWAQMMGPAGILIAFQIVVAAITYFTMVMGRAKKAANELSTAFREEAAAIEIVTAELTKGNLSLEERLDILERYGIINDKTKKDLKEIGLSEEQQNKLLEKRNELIDKNIALEQARKATKDGKTPEQLELEGRKELEEFEESVNKERNRRLDELAVLVKKYGTDEETAAKTRAVINRNADEELLKNANLIALAKAKIQAAEKGELNLKLDIFDIEKEINEIIKDRVESAEKLLKLEQERAAALAELLSARIEQQEGVINEFILGLDEERLESDIEAIYQKFVKHYQRLNELKRLQLEQQKRDELAGVTDRTVVEAIEQKYRILFDLLNKELVESFEEGASAILKVDFVLERQGRIGLLDLLDGPEQSEAQQWAEKEVEKIAKAVTEEFQKRVAETPALNGEGEGAFDFVKAFGMSQERLDAAINLAQTAMSSINNILMAQAEQEIAIETNKTNALNDQLRERLANEQMTADERDKINQQISRNQMELVKKENEINRRRFEQEKAANISMAIIDTFSAATSVLATTKKGAFERIAGMIAVTAAGLANVAAISKQQFVGKALPNPRLTGLGTSEQTGPTFNVVGASNQNQLAQAIQGITANPLKAYVVSSDVSSAQELDRRIVEGASI
jgi:uncharacterized membrane protein